ncbi:MAG TPA: biotin--[acetyl-CoA-carboxylase] ligase [Vicinamibacterales bacterium]
MLDVSCGVRELLAARRDALGALGTHARMLARTTSTNDEAQRWAAEGAPEGAWVLALEQTAGRGRRGRTWVSPPGAGLYLSVIFRPVAGERPDDPRSALLTLMAGVAVAETIRAETGIPVTLKWPNDVVLDERTATGVRSRKLAGILAEGISTGSRLQSVIVGIGINLGPAAYPPEVAARAVSLAEVSRGPLDRDRLLVSLLVALAHRRRALLEGGAAPLLADWRRLSPSSVGTRVRWATGGEVFEGETEGIDERGALIVRSAEGETRLTAGEVVWA